MRLRLSLNEMKPQVTACTRRDEPLRTAGASISFEVLLRANSHATFFFFFGSFESAGIDAKYCVTLVKHVEAV